MNIRSIHAAAVLLVTFAFLNIGCVSHDYLGDHFAPTEHVDVMYNLSGIPDGYKLMGEDKAETTDTMSSEDIVADIVKKAKEEGADAVSIKGMELVVTGSNTDTSGQASAYGTERTHDTRHTEHTVAQADAQYSESSQTTIQKNKVITAQFLKKIH